ncbi:MAG: hypothetical protein ACFFD4_33130 [Candidatus Odinarchaeota archaeon]
MSEQVDQSRKDGIIHGQLSLPYFKQGDDLASSIVERPDGSVDVIQSLINHQELLKGAVEQLGATIEVLKKYGDSYTRVEGDTHWIHLSGDRNVMNELFSRGLVTKDEVEEEEDDYNEIEDS